tara:strand:- start:164 stop:709 length:546 start_codon:yes stop_codon:yes gene_type:complete
MGLRTSKKGSVVDQPWVEVLTMTIMILFLFAFIPAAAEGCSQSQKAHLQNVNYETFDSLAEYVTQFHEDQASSIPLAFTENNVITVFPRCKKVDQVRGVDCAVEPKMCLQSTDTKKIAPYCHQIRGKQGELVDFSGFAKLEVVTNGFSIEKRLDTDRENKKITYTVITFTELGGLAVQKNT